MKISLAIVSMFVGAVLVSACTGGGGGGGGTGYLTAGNYLTSGGTVVSDGCQSGVTPADLNGQSLAVTTSLGIVTIDGNDYPRTGNTFGVSQSANGFSIAANCNVDLKDVLQGTIHQDEFDESETLTESNATGTGCAAVPVTFPCTSKITLKATLQ